MSERRIQTFIIIMFGGSPAAQTFTQFLIDSSNMYVAKNLSKQEFNEKWSRSLSHFLQPTAWHFKFNLFSCAISFQYFNNFFSIFLGKIQEMAIGYFLFFDLTSNHQTDTYEKNNQLQGVSNHDISLSRKEMWDTFLFFMFNQLSKVTV